MNKTHT